MLTVYIVHIVTYNNIIYYQYCTYLILFYYFFKINLRLDCLWSLQKNERDGILERFIGRRAQGVRCQSGCGHVLCAICRRRAWPICSQRQTRRVGRVDRRQREGRVAWTRWVVHNSIIYINKDDGFTDVNKRTCAYNNVFFIK